MEIEIAGVGSKKCIDGMRFMDVKLLKRIGDGIENGDIPEWLLVEILIRIPGKLVGGGCKLVSKQWLSLISEPCFVRTYIARASLLPQPWTFISHIMHHKGLTNSHFPEFVLLEDVQSQVVNPSYCVLPVPSILQCQGGKGNFLIFGVSNGLVLYGMRDMSVKLQFYYICNPVNFHWIALPPLPCSDSFERLGFLTRVESGVLESYTVVRIDRSSGTSSNSLLMFQVFVSDIGEWKIYTVPSKISRLTLERGYVALNEILHWMSVGHGIIAYDPHHSPEVMRFITLPDEIIDNQIHSDANFTFVPCEGKLRYFEVSGTNLLRTGIPSFKLWVLNDYNSCGGDNWCVLHDTILDFTGSELRPLSFHPFDSDIVYLGYVNYLVTYNIKTGKLEVQQKCSTGRRSSRAGGADWWWAFLLVIPPWPITIPGSTFR